MARVANALALLGPIACLTLSACDSAKKSDGSGVAAIASNNPAFRPALPPPSAAPPREPEKPIIRRPKDVPDTMITPERRAKVEAALPEAKGFLTSADLEEKLYKMNLKRGKDADAIKAL